MGEFATASRLYAESIAALAAGTGKKVDFVELYNDAKRAKDQMESAASAFEEHIDSHGCWRSTSDE
jgi:hypothetical protein